MIVLLCLAAPLLLPKASTTKDNGDFTGVYSTFPKFKPLPRTVSSAADQGYVLQKECSSTADEYGVIYSKEESIFLPGLMYNLHGQLSGIAFGVNRSDLFKPDEVSYGSFTNTVNVTIFGSGAFDLFNLVCKHAHRFQIQS